MIPEVWDSLTPAQKDVAFHVGEGKRLEDIAQEAGLSRRTVNKHLSEIYWKLEISGPIKKTILAVCMWRSGLMN